MRIVRVRIAVKALNQSLRLVYAHAPALDQEINHLLVWRDDAGEAADLCRHVGHGGAFIHAQRFDRLAGILNHLRQSMAVPDVLQREQLQDEIFRGYAVALLAANDDLDRLRNFDPHVFREPRIEHVRRTDAKRDAAHGSDMRRMRIGADVKLAGQRITLRHNRVADSFRALAVMQLAVQLDAARFRKIFLLQLQLVRQIEQAHLALFFREHFVQKREVVAEEHDRARIRDRLVLAEKMLEENGRHGRDVFVAEAQIGAGESGIAGLHGLDANMIRVTQHVTRENLFRDGHGARLGVDRRQKGLALQARDVEREEAAVFYHLARDLVLALRELGQRDLFAAADLVNQAKVGRRQHAEVLAILLVNAFDVLGDHQLDARRHFGIRRLLPAGALAAPLAADRAHEAAALHIAALDRRLVAALQAGIGKFAQRFIEEEADVRWRDFVGGDVIAQLGIALRMPGVPGKVLSGKLAFDEFGVFGQEQNAPLEMGRVGALLNSAVQQRIIHRVILPQKRGVRGRSDTARNPSVSVWRIARFGGDVGPTRWISPGSNSRPDNLGARGRPSPRPVHLLAAKRAAALSPWRRSFLRCSPVLRQALRHRPRRAHASRSSAWPPPRRAEWRRAPSPAGGLLLRLPCCTSELRRQTIARNQFEARQALIPLTIDNSLNAGLKLAVNAAHGSCCAHSRAVITNWLSIPTLPLLAWRNSGASHLPCEHWLPARGLLSVRPQPCDGVRGREPRSMIHFSVLLPATRPPDSDGTISQTAERKLPGLTYFLGAPFCAHSIGHHRP